ncbi:MAG: DegT/DnrJ/EryC1/StrS aminotransferase family protein [Candidatus Methanoperedens sp.]|nr:DegT/DnrJ/EryC1/StrS aminotransferase family protein [Candidatus Methanoperedens sp.]
MNNDMIIRRNFLPFSIPSIGDEEIAEVIDTLKSGWITTGQKTKNFEELFKRYVGCNHAIAVSSCTAALHLALVAAGIGVGDEVITTPFTFAATGEVIIYMGAKPVFVDIKNDTYNIDPDKIEAAITSKTKAIIPVHYAGQPCDMDKILKIAHKYNLIVIEDAAHAIGAKYKEKTIGTIGDITAFSFYATKNLTTAEGGMVTTSKQEYADKIRILSLHGLSKDAWKRYGAEGSWYYEIMDAGYKYNMTDIQASIGIHQLAKFEQMQEIRQKHVNRYTDELKDIIGITTPFVLSDVQHAWHLYTILINSDILGLNRAQFIEAMTHENIGTSVHFIPLHLHPYYQKVYGYKRGDFPITEYIYDRIISLPLYTSMTENDVSDVINAIKKIINEK